MGDIPKRNISIFYFFQEPRFSISIYQNPIEIL